MGYSYGTGRPQMVTTRFEEVALTVERKGRCPVCSKRVRRNRTFTNTVSPYNRAWDGHIRTVPEIRAHLGELAQAWVPDFTHDACRVTDGIEDIEGDR